MNKVYSGICLALISSTVLAANPEIGLGISQYNIDRDGLWYQQGYPHSFNTHSQALTLGLTGDTSWVTWHFDAVDLGRTSTNAWATARDAAYNPTTHIGITPPSKLADFSGSGHVYGVLASAGPYIDLNKIRVSFEGGAFLYRATWDENIYHWHAPGQHGQYQDIQAYHNARWELGPMAGISVSLGRWAVQYRIYLDQGKGDDFPTIYNKTETLSIIYTF